MSHGVASFLRRVNESRESEPLKGILNKPKGNYSISKNARRRKRIRARKRDLIEPGEEDKDANLVDFDTDANQSINVSDDLNVTDHGDEDVGEPEGCHYYEQSEVPADLMKYWFQRYSIFSNYDDGMWLTHDAWFGVTPELVAYKIADHMATIAPVAKDVLVDAFAGVAGNTIAFALSGRWKHIFAVEKDPQTIACAKHNAQLCGVDSLITWVQGDIFEEIKTSSWVGAFRSRAVVFASPPWGGPGYGKDHIFDLSRMEPYSLAFLCDAFKGAFGDVALYLPRTSDVRQLAKIARPTERLEIWHYCMHGASKAMCAYLGNFKPLRSK